MFSSILSLIALSPAFAADNIADLEVEVEAACSAAAGTTVTIELPSLLVLDNDNTVRFPTGPACTGRPNLVFRPLPNVVRSKIKVVGSVDGEITLFTFTDGVDVTFEDVVLEGMVPGDAATDNDDGDVSEVDQPQCAELGGRVRGIAAIGPTSGSAKGSLTIRDSTFRCLDAPVDGLFPGDGGGIYAVDTFVDVDNSTFEFNSAVNLGGAIAVSGTTPSFLNEGVALRIRNSDFELNDAILGGAVRNDWPEMDTDVEFSKFRLNVGAQGAGGLDLIDQRQVFIQRNEFDRQNPTNLGLEQEGGSVRVDSSGLETDGPVPSELLWRNNIVCGSWAGRGGGLFVSSVEEIQVQGSVFAESGAIDSGGGLYVEAGVADPNISVVNNSFVGDEAGRTPPFVTPRFVFAIGSGGAASFFGVNAYFQNNVVAYSGFGGGVFGEYVPFSTTGFQVGDPLNYYNNLFHLNSDGQSDVAHTTGDLANISFHPSNLLNIDPELSYLGLGEFNCVPEAFYPLRESIVIDNGGGDQIPDPVTGELTAEPGPCLDYADQPPIDYIVEDGDALTEDGACDIGAFGGRWPLFAKDEDGDGFSNIFDCDDRFQLGTDTNPGESEICDFVDNDCDGLIDEGIQSFWYPDVDGDGFGDASATPTLECVEALEGFVSSNDPENPLNTDCDDDDADTNPEAPEQCNGEDNNCNGESDDGLDFIQYYIDADGDGAGATALGAPACEAPLNGVPLGAGRDCDDTNPNRSPTLFERCSNNIDDDCDSLVDADDPDVAALEYFPDTDGDGDGQLDSVAIRSCDPDPLPGTSRTSGDCQDGNPNVSSLASEVCNNGVDDDCDMQTDEADANTADAFRFFVDQDGDGFGSASAAVTYSCDPNLAPANTVDNALDCNDADPNVGDCSNGCDSVGNQASILGVFAGMFLAAAGRRRRD